MKKMILHYNLYSWSEIFAVEYGRIFDTKQGSDDNAHPAVRQEKLSVA